MNLDEKSQRIIPGQAFTERTEHERPRELAGEGKSIFLTVKSAIMYFLRSAVASAAIAALACSAAIAYPSTLKLKLYAQNRPGETGTAMFEQIEGGVKVVIKMAGGQNGTQPVHIHTGTCAKLNPIPAYALSDIVHGSSTTTLSGITIGDLLKGKYVLDIHESSADEKRYVACAAIAVPEHPVAGLQRNPA